MPECPLCGDDCWHVSFGYIGCPNCDEHHRPPVCPIDQDGRALRSWCGCPHDLGDEHLPTCRMEWDGDEADPAPNPRSASSRGEEGGNDAGTYLLEGNGAALLRAADVRGVPLPPRER